MRVGYHASHEQFTPAELLAFVREAEAAGFREAMCSDHLAPFTPQQGQSGFAWSWLGAALACTNLTLGTVNAPGQRYNPVIIAQAIATLAQMFEGRLWVAFGSGQYINEHVTGAGWPPKETRKARLLECVSIIRALLAGECVQHQGEVTASQARLYTLPAQQPKLFAAAITSETAAWAGSWADGLITVYQGEGRMEETVAAFRNFGGEGKPVFLQAQHAFAPTYEEALEEAVREWRQCVVSNSVITDLRFPEQIDEASALATANDVAARVRISADPGQHLAWLCEYEELGFDAVYVHNVSRRQREFIEAFGQHVLPHFAYGGKAGDAHGAA